MVSSKVIQVEIRLKTISEGGDPSIRQAEDKSANFRRFPLLAASVRSPSHIYKHG